MSISSTKMRPLVGSTKRKNDSARVLFPEPVRPRTPIFSPGLISKLSSCRTLGRSGWRNCSQSSFETVEGISTYSVTDDKVLALDGALLWPGGCRPRLDELWRLALNLGELLDTLDRNHGLLETDESADLSKSQLMPRRPICRRHVLGTEAMTIHWSANIREEVRGYVHP